MSAPGPERVADYRLLRELGRGAMGAVYEAEDERTGARVALKLLGLAARAEPGRTERFLREARAATAIEHANVARALAAGDSGGYLWIAMELVSGHTLREHLRDGPYPVSETLRLGLPIARGVAAAHAHGIVHRDLKPENIYLTPEGAVKVLDFGLSKKPGGVVDEMNPSGAPVRADITGKTIIVGSPGYMSPEQISARTIDHRSDIFSLGILLYEMLTGGRPFHGESRMLIMVATCSDQPMAPSERRPDCPPTLERAILRCLEKRPDDRYASCEALIADLEKARGEL